MVVTFWNCGDVSPDDAYNSTSFNPDDLPPEYCSYRDDGCRYAASCLDCPYGRCLEELPSGDTAFVRCIREAAMLEHYHRGCSRQEIAARFRVSYRTVLRLVERCRASPGADVMLARDCTNNEKGDLYDAH